MNQTVYTLEMNFIFKNYFFLDCKGIQSQAWVWTLHTISANWDFRYGIRKEIMIIQT